MLVLSRRKNEKIIFILPNGKEIELSVVSTHAYRVRLGITAPDNVEILREEIKKRTSVNNEKG